MAAEGVGVPGTAALQVAIREAADPLTVLQRIVEQSVLLVPGADGASLEVRRDEATLEYLCAAGELAPFVGLQLPIAQSFSGLAVLSGQLIRCDDALHDERVNRAAVQRTGVVSMMCVPLSEEQGSIAVLKVSSRKPNAFSDADTHQLELIAGFLRTTARAAVELATVTMDLLTHMDGTVPRDAGTVDAARFVANVMTPGLVDRVRARTEIRDAIAQRQFRIVWQPIVEFATGRIVAAEALARFDGDHSALWWFSSANTVGLADELEFATAECALESLDDLPSGIRLALNAGPSLAASPAFAELLSAHPAERLTLELTEHEAVADYPGLISALEPLRAAGVCLSVDDAGSGYSGLAHLLRLTPDVIKLDRELVTGIEANAAKRALASGLVVFARSIAAEIVAEGVETAAEAACAAELGITLAQGNFFSDAVAPTALSALAQAPSA